VTRTVYAGGEIFDGTGADPFAGDLAVEDGLITEIGSGLDGDEVVGSVMGGYDGHRGWLYYLATAETHRGLGVGAALVTEVETLLLAMGCPKVQLMVRPDNARARGFYDTLGYEPFDAWSTGKRLIAD
jgi:ribosomal protein S18 acetylase RimI-like enzyme